MKKIIYAALIVCATVSVQAQDAKTAKASKEQNQKAALSPEDKAIRILRRMTGPAQLSSEQTEKIKPLLIEREKSKEAIKKAAAPDMRKQLKALNDKYEAQLKGIMKPEQWQGWEKFRAEQKEKRKENNAPESQEQDLD